MNRKLYQALRRGFTPMLLCAGLVTGHAVQAAATFKADTGELILPAVMMDWENSLYAVTLKRATLNAPLTLGDEFEIKTLTPNATPEARNSNFLTASSTAYVPEVQVGDKTYRLLMQFVPQKGTLRISSMEDATLYSSISGEPSISSYFQRLQQQINQAEMPTACSVASLYGVYSYATGGNKYVNNQWAQFLEIGVNYFDGQGNLLKAYTNSLNSKTETVKGKYSVASNCRGEISYDTGEKFSFFTPPMGDKFYYIQSVIKDTGNADTGWMERQSKGLDFTCTVATLKGTYAYGGRGLKNNMEYTETGLESFDGKGNVTNIYTDTQLGQEQQSRGTYQITPYCDALVTYESKESNFMHVAPDGESMPFIQYGGLKDGEIFGGVERRVSLLSYDLAPSVTATTSTTRRSGAFDTNAFSSFTLPADFSLKPTAPPPPPPPPPVLIDPMTMKVETPFVKSVGVEEAAAKIDSSYTTGTGANNMPKPAIPPIPMDTPEGCAKNHGTWKSSYCFAEKFAGSESHCSSLGGSFMMYNGKDGRPDPSRGGKCWIRDYEVKTAHECSSKYYEGRWNPAGCSGFSNPYFKYP